MEDQGALAWHKSTYSGEANQCVEQGLFPSGQIAVRDTKDDKTGPVLSFDRRGWAAFISDVVRPCDTV